MNVTVHESDITIDGSLLLSIARRRAAVWIGLSLLLFVVVLAYQLYVVPQTYTATVSITVQQPPSGSAGALALLAGQAGNSKYIGILKSRRMAEEVEQKVHLAQLYHIPFEAAVGRLLGSLRIKDDPVDGLVYVDVTLPGPPRRAQDAVRMRPLIASAVAQVGNAYVAALRRYYVTTDNERDSVLLRGADDQLRLAQAKFKQSTEALRLFARSLRSSDPRVLPTADKGGAGGGGGSSASLGALPDLYNALAETEIEIRVRQAANDAQSRLIQGQLQNLRSLPTEDPLLRQRRADVNDAAIRLRMLEVNLGKDNPNVVLQRKRLEILQQALRQEQAGIISRHTTDTVRSQTALEGLRVRRASLERQIQEAKGLLRERTELSADYNDLQFNVDLSFGALKTAVEEAAKLRMGTVSAQSRIAVVDDARPPTSSQPGLFRMALTCVAVVLAVLLAWLGIEYVARSRRVSPGPVSPLGAAEDTLPIVERV